MAGLVLVEVVFPLPYCPEGAAASPIPSCPKKEVVAGLVLVEVVFPLPFYPEEVVAGLVLVEVVFPLLSCLEEAAAPLLPSCPGGVVLSQKKLHSMTYELS